MPSFCVDGFSSLRKGDARVSEFGFGNEGEGGSPSGFPFRIALHDEVKRALEAGEPEGLVVRALRQVSGYGRQGRSWTSPEGGLYCSLLLRPQVAPRELPTLSLVVGMAVRRALVARARGLRRPCASNGPTMWCWHKRRAMHDFLKQPKFVTWGFPNLGRN